MTHLTSKPQKLAIMDLPERAFALRAGIRGELTNAISLHPAIGAQARNVGFHAHILRRWFATLGSGWLKRYLREIVWNLGQAQALINGDIRQGARRHTRHHGFLGILYNGQTTTTLDRQQSRSAIVERSGEHDTNDAWTIGERCRSEERIYRGTKAVFARPRCQPHMPLLDEQVRTRWRDKHLSLRDGLSIGRVFDRQGARSPQNLRENAWSVLRHMHDDEYSCWQFAGQATRDLCQRFHTASRGSDNNDIVSVHVNLLSCRQRTL
jgi:hypothetical protein